MTSASPSSRARLGADVADRATSSTASTRRSTAKAALDELIAEAPPPGARGRGRAARPGDEHKSAFEAYVRRGDERACAARGQGAVGRLRARMAAIWCPTRPRREIGRRLAAVSPIRAHRHGARRCPARCYKKPFALTGPATGWVAETAARPQTNTPTLGRAAFPDHGALRHAGGDRRRFSTTPPSMSTSGSPRRSTPPSPSRRAPPSSPATAPTSRRASSTTTRSPRRSWAWDKIGYVATGVSGALARRTTRPTC